MPSNTSTLPLTALSSALNTQMRVRRYEACSPITTVLSFVCQNAVDTAALGTHHPPPTTHPEPPYTPNPTAPATHQRQKTLPHQAAGHKHPQVGDNERAQDKALRDRSSDSSVHVIQLRNSPLWCPIIQTTTTTFLSPRILVMAPRSAYPTWTSRARGLGLLPAEYSSSVQSGRLRYEKRPGKVSAGDEMLRVRPAWMRRRG